MTTSLRPQSEYDIKARRISGTRAEKLDQIDRAIQELLDIKALECLADVPNVQFLAVPQPRGDAFAMTLTILVLFIALVLLVGVRTSHAQDASAAVSQGTEGGFVRGPSSNRVPHEHVRIRLACDHAFQVTK